jgi:hypothetical protein
MFGNRDRLGTARVAVNILPLLTRQSPSLTVYF